jgi:hypothetical protein
MKKIIALTLMIGLLFTLPAWASNRGVGYRGFGPRVGLTINPDQVHVGAHIDFGDIAGNLMMLPNLEVGFGDDVTTIAPTFELDYRFRPDWGAWTPYLGGGMGPVFYSVKNGGSSKFKLGIYLQFGIGKGSSGSESGHFFLEGKLGLADAPDGKVTVGWTFGN